MKTGIFGGGLTGLTLDYLLSQRSVDVELLEKEKELGGLMRTLREDGFAFDWGGSHIIFSKNKEALDFMLRLLGENKVLDKRNTKVLYKGSYIKYPFENGLADLPKQENFECLYAFIENLLAKEEGKVNKPANLKEWFHYTFGSGIAQKYLVPYNQKIWKHPLEDMTLEWVERIPNPPVADIVKSSLGIKTEGYTHQSNFYYPLRGGIQTVIESLAKNVQSNITVGFEVKKVRKEGGCWVISNGKEEKVYDKIVSTIPIQALIKAMDAPKRVRAAADDLKFNSLVTVMLGLNTANINDFSWLYIPEETSLPHRVSFPSNYSSYVTPRGKSSVLAEVTCRKDDDTWIMDDQEITDRVIDDLHRLHIMDKESVCFTKAKRSTCAYVLTDTNYAENLKTVKSYVSKAGIDLLGRFSEFKYLNMDGCVENVMNYVKEKFKSS
ncbi:MAG: FAD-dependent oxidoreductase [Candidatus Bathyarchaeia archaeon]